MDYNYSTYNYNLSDADPSANAAIAGGVIVFMLFFILLSYAITAFLLGRIFKKAGVPQWAAWVPVYNTWKLLELGNQQGFWAVLAFIPFVNIVSLIFMIIAMYNIGLKLGKEGWFVLIGIFLPLVWMIWLGFDDSKWQSGKKAVTAKKTTRAKKSA
jgi:hypothetical protein